MTRQFRIALGVALALFALPGCLILRHPAPIPPCEVCHQFEAVPDDSMAGVYVFFVNGNDPLNQGNLKSIHDHLRKLGFTKTYFGEVDNDVWMAEELFCVHRDHPGSRFIVVGFEYGADSARRIVQAGLNGGATIDMLLYIEPKGTIFNVPAPEGRITRTVVVQNKYVLTKSAPIEGSEVVSLSARTRYELPTRPEVVDLLVSATSAAADLVPIIVDAPEPVPALLNETAPTPRAYKQPRIESLDDWDFLKRLSKGSIREPQPQRLATERRPNSNSTYQIDNPYNSMRPVAVRPKNPPLSFVDE